jgi:hypothetical protein
MAESVWDLVRSVPACRLLVMPSWRTDRLGRSGARLPAFLTGDHRDRDERVNRGSV